MYVLIFLASIIVANLSVAYFGPVSSPINAFILIGLDLSLRDKLHESWHGNHLGWKMLGLIVTSGVLTYTLNRGAGQIAVASVVAFCGAMVVDVVMYQWLFRHSLLFKMNGSNVGSAAVDSILFPTIAFGALMPVIVILQFTAKVLGGFLWSLVISRASKVGTTPEPEHVSPRPASETVGVKPEQDPVVSNERR